MIVEEGIIKIQDECVLRYVNSFLTNFARPRTIYEAIAIALEREPSMPPPPKPPRVEEIVIQLITFYDGRNLDDILAAAIIIARTLSPVDR